jgi:SpoU rRNA methylase family enzyme
MWGPLYNSSVPIGATSGNKIQTLYYAEDLGRHCRKIDREAKLAIEETGTNMLYLVFGFLEYPENPTSDKLYKAPLVCLPVRIEKTDSGPYTTFDLVYTGEELADNLSLREKVNRDFGLTLPEFDEDGTLASYFNAIEQVIENQPQWRLCRMMSLTLLSFANMLLVRDLDPVNWSIGPGALNPLLHHPIVRRVFEGGASSEDAIYGEEYAIDDHKHVDLPLIYDADSSQHSALIDVIEGRNLVIEGPPGTGKSQTITNLIAAALHMGKKVLFVSEKLAALEVVKSRLAHAGLEHFILELHSNKTSKKRVIEDIEKRTQFRPLVPDGLDTLLVSLETKRKELKAHADLLNGVHGNNQNLTVHKVLWRAEKFRSRLGAAADAVQGLTIGFAPTVLPPQFHALYDTLRYIAKNFDEIGTYNTNHPFWGFFPEEIRPGQELEIQAILTQFIERFDTFAKAMADAANLLGSSKLNMSALSAKNLINVLATLAPANSEDIAFDLLPKLFTGDDPFAANSTMVIEDIAARLKELESIHRVLANCWIGTFNATVDHVNQAQYFNTNTSSLNVGSTVCANLPKKLNTIIEAADSAIKALSVIDSVAIKVGLPFDGSPDSIEKLCLVLSLAETAPDEFLYMRHEGMRHPHAHDALKAAAVVLDDIQAKRLELNNELYLDMTPSDNDLKTAILVLREGDAWFRILQKRWRVATGLHKRLQRSKEKTPVAVRLAQLEKLLTVTQSYEIWRNDADLRSFAGPNFKDQDTSFTALISLTGWMDSALKHLQSNQVGLNVFDPLSVSVVQLAQLRSLKTEVDTALVILEQYTSVQKQELPDAAFLANAINHESWIKRLTLVKQTTSRTVELYDALEEFLNVDEVLCDDVFSVVKASNHLPIAIEELNNHQKGRQLLGGHFKGALTNLDPIEGSLVYGKLIKSAKLPQSVETALLSETSPQNYAFLSELVNTIQAGWDATDELVLKMSQYGQVNLSQWVDESTMAHSEYARQLADKTRVAFENLDRLQVWSQYVAQRKEAVKEALLPFVTLMEEGKLHSRSLPDAFAYRFYASIAELLFQSTPHLSRFNGVRHSTVRSEFAELDKQIIKLRGQQISIQCVSQAKPPAGFPAAKVGEKTEMELIKHLMSLTTPRTPVRQILRRAGRAVQALKPCFMMGPQAVAQFLEPGHLDFDIIVMDEASQLKPEEALGAIARGKQLVVVGDPKQLPPTSFFSRQNQAGDGDDSQQTAAEDAESILDVCIGHFQPVRTLRWHYRSRHESLIAFSNHYFYKGKLFVFPSPYPKGNALGLHYIPVPNGVYENQMNKIEALRVVDAIVEHITYRPDDSLGVVTLNIKQRDLIAELWEERRKSTLQADEYETRWAAEGMGLFFKNLENVQGDERDCILISTTFGKAPGVSKPRQNFGPISRQGGWRRLNVLFTRARKSIGLITSMQPEDIIADNSTPEGTKALRNYLEYARSGFLPQDRETGLEPDSDFEVSVIELIESWGYTVTPQLGVAGFRIDIAVKHPEYPSAYLAAIECDGATYHSGVSVRDRDRIRQEILESLGWKGKIWRIWSTDWFRSPLVEAKKLYSFLESLKATSIPKEFIIDVNNVSDNNFKGDETSQVELDEQEAAIGILDEGDDDLEIEVGDFVTYTLTNGSEEPKTVQITTTRTAVEYGLIASHTPLAQALLGASVGDSVILRVPGQPVKTYIVKSIKRPEVDLVS